MLSDEVTLTPDVASNIRDEAMRLLKSWRDLLLTKHVPIEGNGIKQWREVGGRTIWSACV